MPRLAVLLVGGLTLWAIACVLLHGPAILTYIGLQAVTSGIFAWEMTRLERSTRRRPADATAHSSSSKAA